MERRAWQPTVHEVSRVRHDLVTKPTLSNRFCLVFLQSTAETVFVDQGMGKGGLIL